MRKLLLSLFCLSLFLPAVAQVEVKDFDNKEFPSVSFNLRSYNPEVQTSEQIRVFEEDTLVNVSNFEHTGTLPLPAIKNVLFLWDLRGRESFVPELLYDFLNGMIASDQTSDSLRVNVAVFMRDEEGKPSYTPLLSSFSSDLEEIRNRVTEEAEKELTEKSSSSDILWAIEQAVDQMKVLSADEAKAIVLCTAGKNNSNSGSETTHLVTQARANRIQIYVVNIAGGEAGETISKNLSSRTYGRYLLSDGSFETKEKREDANRQAIDKKTPIPYSFLFDENESICVWVNQLPQRWAGNTYRVTFDSRFGRIGQNKEVKVQLGDDSDKSVYAIPKYTFKNWIKDHLVLFLILLFVVVAGIGTGLFFLIRYWRDMAAEKREEEEQLEAERKRLKQEQDNLRRKLDVAENEQRRRQEQERAKEKAAKRQEEIEAMNSLMRSKNIRARVLVSTMTGAFEYQVATSENTIGSAEDNDIIIEDKTVSRHHAVLYFNGQTFGIRDLHSTNGVVINGFRVEDLKLRNGDSVTLGNSVMKIYF